MKFHKLFTLLMSALLACGYCYGQTDNPYAIFGGNPYISQTDNERTGEYVMVVKNYHSDSGSVYRMEHNVKTGEIKLFDAAGNLLQQRQLTANEYAWSSIDPLAEKYYSLSPYAYAGNNPVMNIDPNGEEFYIYYEDENGEQQRHLFNPNEKYEGGNEFVANVYEAYNHLKEGGVDMSPFDTFIGNENTHMNLYHADKNPNGAGIEQGIPNRDYVVGKEGEQTAGTAYWDPENGLVFNMPKGEEGHQPPSLGLLHEVGHVYRATEIGGKAAMRELRKSSWNSYTYVGEEWVITTKESPAAEIMGFPQRKGYVGGGYKTTGVTSTKRK